jgi:acetate kinase
VPLVALFETAFYQWVPEAATRYAVPQAWHEAGVRRYGFHGASHKFIAERSPNCSAAPTSPIASANSTRPAHAGRRGAPRCA